MQLHSECLASQIHLVGEIADQMPQVLKDELDWGVQEEMGNGGKKSVDKKRL